MDAKELRQHTIEHSTEELQTKRAEEFLKLAYSYFKDESEKGLFEAELNIPTELYDKCIRILENKGYNIYERGLIISGYTPITVNWEY